MNTPYNVSARLRSVARSWWGPIQWSRTLAPGVLAVTTGGHGGILVDPAVYPLHPALRNGLDGYIERWVSTRTGDETSRVVGFEEDCGWAPLVLAHPDLAEACSRKGYVNLPADEVRAHALSSAGSSYPDIFAAIGC